MIVNWARLHNMCFLLGISLGSGLSLPSRVVVWIQQNTDLHTHVCWRGQACVSLWVLVLFNTWHALHVWWNIHPGYYKYSIFSFIFDYSTCLISLLFLHKMIYFSFADLHKPSLWDKSGVSIYNHGAHGHLGILCCWGQLPKPETLPALPRQGLPPFQPAL